MRLVSEGALRLSASAAAGALVPADALTRLLRALCPVIDAGRDTLVRRGDAAGGAPALAAAAALEAAVAGLRVMTAPGAPQQGAGGARSAALLGTPPRAAAQLRRSACTPRARPWTRAAACAAPHAL